MANDEYIKENFKPDKLWACPSFTGSSFPGITPPAEGGGGMYQIGEDLNFTLGSYYDYELPKGSVNGDAFYNAEYKAGAYVINKGYIYNYIGDLPNNEHVFMNIRPEPNSDIISYTQPTDFRCELIIIIKGNPSTPDGGAYAYYTSMPQNDSGMAPTIKINGVTLYGSEYIDLMIPSLCRHDITLTPDDATGEFSIICSVVNTIEDPYSYAMGVDELLSYVELGYIYAIQSDTTIGLIDLKKTLYDSAGIRFRSNPIIFAPSGTTLPSWDTSIQFTITDVVSYI